MSLRVLLVEDHTILRSGLRALLEEAGGMTVVGEANDGHDAVKLALALQPDVVVMDVAMPNLNGIDATRQIKRERPAAGVLILSMHGDRQYVFEALRAGASGYLLKDAAVTELIRAIREVAEGRRYLCHGVSEIALDELIGRARGDTASSELDRLTEREREVLQLIAEGRRPGEIGQALHVSVFTVQSHRRNLMEKLQLRNKIELVKFALRHGLTSLS